MWLNNTCDIILYLLRLKLRPPLFQHQVAAALISAITPIQYREVRSDLQPGPNYGEAGAEIIEIPANMTSRHLSALFPLLTVYLTILGKHSDHYDSHIH